MGEVVQQVRAYVTQHALIPPGQTVVVGVSGGADSLVLLHVLLALRAEFDWRLHVATLDHGLRDAASAADAAFVRATAEAWQVPVTVGQAAVQPQPGQGLEVAARRVRYAFLAQVARTVGAARIAVGHNQDDQAETVLLHLIRGSGLTGLGGMRPQVPVSALTGEQSLAAAEPVLVVRPLLAIPRAVIDAYAAEHGLNPRQDATNQDQAYTRNRIRHAVIPLLETLNPNVKATLARTAALMQADAELIAAAGQRALERVARSITPTGAILDRAVWTTLSVAEQRYVLRHLVQGDDLGFEHIEQAREIAGRGDVGSAATLPGGLELRVERECLTITPAGAPAIYDSVPRLPVEFAGPPFTVDGPLEQVIGDWVFTAARLTMDDDLVAIHADPLAVALAVPEGAGLSLRTRRDGDRFRPRGMGGRSQKLVDTLNALHVPALWRDHVPLLIVDPPDGPAEIAWLVVPTAEGGRGRVAEPFAIHEHSRNETIIVLRWRSMHC